MAKDDRMPKIFIGQEPGKVGRRGAVQHNESERVEDVSDHQLS